MIMKYLRGSHREAIETALTLYDSIGVEKVIEGINNSHNWEYKGPKEYWMRGHNTRRYIPGTIVTLVQDKILKRGWAYNGNCTFLHNSGYVIVDKTGNPVTKSKSGKAIPEGYNYLEKGEDRIISVARTYYIEQARKLGKLRVQINVAKMAKKIGPTVNRSRVCNVLRSSMFQALANADLIGQTSESGKNTGNLTFKLRPTYTQFYSPELDLLIKQKGYSEGSKLARIITYFERNSKNRKEALKEHGYRCKACGVLLEDLYGEIARELIEVHHLVPISKLRGSTEINPKKDLVPLCPNCHRVAHKRIDEPLTPNKIKKLIEENKK